MIQKSKYIPVMRMLSLIVAVAAAAAALIGIFSTEGPGPFTYESIRGEEVLVHGIGVYKHMPADVAIQGIAQDWITLVLAVPVLLFCALRLPRFSRVGKLIHAGTVTYFFIGYTMYLAMGMYNILFLVYVLLSGVSLILLLLLLFNVGTYSKELPVDSIGVRFPGIFLIVNGINISLLWFSVILPPLLNGTIYPEGLSHFTTMIVQGLDLALFLPMSVITGALLLKRHPLGYLGAPVYLTFLAFQMTNLTAKLIAMGMAGVEILPAIIIIPATLVVDVAAFIRMLRQLKKAEGMTKA